MTRKALFVFPLALAVTFLLSLINHLLVIVFRLPGYSLVPFLRTAPDNIKNTKFSSISFKLKVNF